MKTIICILITLALFLNSSLPATAADNPPTCPNRYLTLINPVRGRELWKDKTLSPIKTQYTIISHHNFPATWLLQYDVLTDRELINEIKSFDIRQEKGVFLEVSKTLAEKARVIYAHDSPWYSPGTVFLSGYTQSERKRLIDVLMGDFKQEFGSYPKSVGAWWIDSYSLDYLQKKYQVTSALIVADQKTTDNYGIWGQWWGVPYYPAKSNILTPASGLADKQNILVLQWAQRHPVLAYGQGYKSSYSLQANDYTLLQKDLNFFKELSDIYLNCQNPVGQITIGLETGMESIPFINEYKQQLDNLKTKTDLKHLTMNQFAEIFSTIHPDFPQTAKISYQDSTWMMTPQKRVNQKFGETTIYNQEKSFSDYFVPDKSQFLNRNLTNSPVRTSHNFDVLILISILLFAVYCLKKKLLWYWISAVSFLISSYGLLLKSFSLYGYNVYFGPAPENLLLSKILVTVGTFIIFWLIWRKLGSNYGKFFTLIPLSFAADPLLNTLRISFISGKYYLGFATDALHFTGISFSKLFNFNVVNQDFPSYLATALLRFDFNKIWNNQVISLLFYPLTHLIAGLLLMILIKKLPKKLAVLIIIILSLLLLVHLKNTINADPRTVRILE